MSNKIVPFNDLQRMGVAIAKSRLFGMKNEAEAIALMLIAQAEGKHPATAARDYYIIQGRPALKADAMLARFQESGGSVEWIKLDDAMVSAKFSHPQSGSVTITWDMERAENAGLFRTHEGVRLQKTREGWKPGAWQKYPRQLLRSRVISEGVRTCCPAACNGVYTPEEVRDFEPEKQVREVASEVVEQSALFCPECGAEWKNNRCSANCQVVKE